MQEQIKQIEGLMGAVKQAAPRTPFLEVCLGALVTARDNAVEHLAELERRKKAEAKAKG